MKVKYRIPYFTLWLVNVSEMTGPQYPLLAREADIGSRMHTVTGGERWRRVEAPRNKAP
jgi:hypothetical protein